MLGQVYDMYEDAKKGKDAARIRAFIEVRPCSWSGGGGLTVNRVVTVNQGQARAIE